MRLVILLLSFSGLLYQSVTALRCLECAGASTEAECRINGTVRECEFNEDACEIELRRHEGWYGSLKMYKHCKQSKACDNNYLQNPRSAWEPSQCNEKNFNSVCRCCCYTDECNVANDDCFGGSGCGTLPSVVSYGTVSCTNGRNYGSVCTVTCDANRNMVGQASTICRMDGSWSHPLPSCGGIFCGVKTLQYGWYTCSNGFQGGSTCTPNCWPGYTPSGPKSITCIGGRWNNAFEPSCRRLQCPPLGEVAGGNITCSNDRYAQSRCRITCEEGRRLIGIPTTYCQDNGVWSHPLPICDRLQCPPRGRMMHGAIECTAGVEVGSSCLVICNNGYAVDGTADSECLPTGQWENPLPKCIRVTCPPRGRLAGGTVTCTNGVNAGSVCTASCTAGTQLIGANVSECLDTGEWSAPLPTCRRIVCPVRDEVNGGSVTCSRKNFIRSVCTVRCRSGSRLVGQVTSECLPSGEWNFPLPDCEVITCPLLDFSTQPGTMSCSNDNLYRSICRFSCERGFVRFGAPRIRCGRNGRWNTRMPFCSLIRCPPRGTVANGELFCSNDNEVDSICVVSCAPGYQLLGPEDSTCLGNGRWDNPLPQCARVRCPPRNALVGGTVTCTNRNFVESVCTATCRAGTAMIGSPFSACLENGEWDLPLPICDPQPCPTQDALTHGSVRCTNGANQGSVCTFQCLDEGYELYPTDRTSLTCRNNQLWSNTRPCCSRPCPPYAVMDLVIVLDSSSSIGQLNWNSLTKFVREVIGSFRIAPDVANIAIFRYNRNVDTATQILLNSYPGDINGLLAAFARIPYNGSGTFTGRGLTHALDVSLAEANGNRPGIPDVVLVITDGKAADDVQTPANNLRNAGATVMVLGIEPPRGQLDQNQLLQIAGTRSNLVIASGGFDGLDNRFALTLAGTICGDPCD